MAENGSSPPSIEIDWPDRQVAVVTLLGEHDWANANDLQSTLENVLATASTVVVDVSSTEFLDSSIIHKLMGAQRRATQDGVDFALVADKNSFAWRVLDVLTLLKTIRLVDSIDEALPIDQENRRQPRSQTVHHHDRHANA